jgi:uncharacterized protein (TIGR03067 family)
MRRFVCLLVGVLLVVPALGSDSPKEYGGATDGDELQGTWELVSSGCVGRESPPHPLHRPCIQTYRRGKWTYQQAGRVLDEGTYTSDSRRKLAFLDETKTGGEAARRTQEYIYRIDGDTLRTAFRLDERGRPQSFDEDDLFIIIYKRVK